MALKNVVGVDHAVVMAKDLDKAAEGWRRLGFTISPRGTHSAHMGTGNYTIMLDPDYIDCWGCSAPTEHNAPARALPRDARRHRAGRFHRDRRPPAPRKSARADMRRWGRTISSGL